MPDARLKAKDLAMLRQGFGVWATRAMCGSLNVVAYPAKGDTV